MTKRTRITRTETRNIVEELLPNLDTIRTALVDSTLTPAQADAWAHIEAFCMIAVRIIASTNASKVRQATVLVEIQSRMAAEEQRNEARLNMNRHPLAKSQMIAEFAARQGIEMVFAPLVDHGPLDELDGPGSNELGSIIEA